MTRCLSPALSTFFFPFSFFFFFFLFFFFAWPSLPLTAKPVLLSSLCLSLLSSDHFLFSSSSSSSSFPSSSSSFRFDFGRNETDRDAHPVTHTHTHTQKTRLSYQRLIADEITKIEIRFDRLVIGVLLLLLLLSYLWRVSLFHLWTHLGDHHLADDR